MIEGQYTNKVGYTFEPGEPVLFVTQGHQHHVEVRVGKYVGFGPGGPVVEYEKRVFKKKDGEYQYIDAMRKSALFRGRMISIKSMDEEHINQIKDLFRSL
jgi:hypothetical protein